ncbi:MAG TPA: hypothetical protein VN253_23830 [Kofleriaceae bacterium]|nr:hypothetical protein [Kofleriaceae bacterium]
MVEPPQAAPVELLAGVRTGEAAALRWRHYDPTKQPLGELLVAFSSADSDAARYSRATPKNRT